MPPMSSFMPPMSSFMPHMSSFMPLLLFLLLANIGYSQYCPALGPDQILPCGVGSTTLTANLSQCGAGNNPNQTSMRSSDHSSSSSSSAFSASHSSKFSRRFQLSTMSSGMSFSDSESVYS